MKDPLTLPALIHAAGFALGMLLTVLLLASRKDNRVANRWLAAYVACISLCSFENALEDSRAILEWPSIAHLTDWMTFLIGPCLWMYVRRLTKHATPSFLRWLPHTALAAACLWLLASRFYFLPVEEKIRGMQEDYVIFENSLNEPLLIGAAQIMCYWVASLFVLRRFRASLRERYSSLGQRSFDWLRTLLLIMLVVWIVWVIGLLLRAPLTDLLSSLAVTPGLFLLAFLGFRQPDVFLKEDEPAAAASSSAARYARSGLDRERVPEYLARLENVMRTEKPWLESDLTLADLSARAQLSPHNLSQLLNEEIGKSFFDYINAQRVEEVKRCLLDPAYDSQTILEIALGAGFSSKTAFNAAFRQHASMTPSQYRRRERVQPGPQSA